MASKVVEVRLPNGATAHVQVRELDGVGATKTGLRDALDFEGVARSLEGITDAIRTAVAKAAPNKVSVELGIELALKSGTLVGLIVDGESKGSLKVNLEWGRDEQPERGA